MSAALAEAIPRVPQRQTFANLGVFTRFTFRRNWVRFAVWTLVVVGMLAFIIDYYKQLFTDQAELQKFVATVHQPGLMSMVGIISNPASIAGAVWSKYWMFGSLMLAIGVLFLMTRNLRADEDAGRAELMRSTPLGIHARLASAVVLMSGLSVVVGVLSGLVAAAMGLGTDVLPAGQAAQGAWIMGISIGLMGLLGVGVGAVVNEVSPSSGAANGTGVAVFGVFYILRMVADLQATVGTDGTLHETWLAWVSPIGWGQRMDPWGANRWWLAVPVVALSAVLVASAWVLQGRRDLGDSLAPQRTGQPDASSMTTTVWGLGLRLQRGALIGWAVGIAVYSALLGSVIKSMRDMITGMNLGGIATIGTSEAAVTGNLLIPVVALIIGVFAVQSATTLRIDETRGVLESQLAAGVGRLSWVLQRLAVTVVAVVAFLVVAGLLLGASYSALVPGNGQVTAVVGAFLVFLPACLLMAAVFVLGLGWWPRYAVTVAWAVVGALWAFMVVGLALKIPQAVLDLTPFSATPRTLSGPMHWTPVLVLTGVAAAMTVVGLVGFRRRDIPVT